jgi:hypothetical protein
MTADIAWTRFGAVETTKSGFEILRCGATALGPLLILSTEPMAVPLHFWQGKSFPHLTQNCPACAAKRPSKMKLYVVVLDPKRNAQYVLEMTDGVTDRIREHLEQFGSLRGSYIRLSRPSGKANGKLFAQFDRSNMSDHQLAKPIDLIDYLVRLWQIDPSVTMPKQPIQPDAITSEAGQPPENWRMTKTLDEHHELVDQPTARKQQEKRNGKAYTGHGMPK